MNTYKSRTLAAVLFIAVVFSMCSVSFATDTESAYMAKIRDEVWETDADENGYRSVALWRYGILESDVEERFLSEYGYQMQDYDDFDTYNNVTEPAIIKDFYEKHGIDLSIAVEDLDSETRRALNTEIHEKFDDYRHNFISLKSDMYDEYNNAFLERYSVDASRLMYVGGFTGTIVMLATEEEICEFASDEEVGEISIWEDHYAVNQDVDDENDPYKDLVTDAESETESLPAEETEMETIKETEKETTAEPEKEAEKETVNETEAVDDGNERRSYTTAVIIALSLVVAVVLASVIVIRKRRS